MKRVFIESNDYFTLAIKENNGKIVDVLAMKNDSVIENIYWARVENARANRYFINFDNKRPNGVLQTDRKLKSGDYIICQAVKEELNDKGAVFKDEITISHKFLILCDGFQGYKYSKKISKEQRERFIDIETINNLGFIIRNNAVTANIEQLKNAIDELQNKYIKIKKDAFGSIKCLFEKPNFEKAIEEMDLDDSYEIITNDENYRDMQGVRIETEILSQLELYGLKQEFYSLFSRKLSLPKGEIVFDYTEAMTVIDINSSGAFGLDTDSINKLAMEEIIRQIKLRNISGIIFIDTISQKASNDLAGFANKLLKDDRERAKAEWIKNLGIVAINRQRRYNNLNANFYGKCYKCGGMGWMKSPHMVCWEIAHDIKKLCHKRVKNIVIKLGKDIFDKIEKTSKLVKILKPPTKANIYIKKDIDVINYAIQLTDDSDLLIDAVKIQEDE